MLVERASAGQRYTRFSRWAWRGRSRRPGRPERSRRRGRRRSCRAMSPTCRRPRAGHALAGGRRGSVGRALAVDGLAALSSIRDPSVSVSLAAAGCGRRAAVPASGVMSRSVPMGGVGDGGTLRATVQGGVVRDRDNGRARAGRSVRAVLAAWDGDADAAEHRMGGSLHGRREDAGHCRAGRSGQNAGRGSKRAHGAAARQRWPADRRKFDSRPRSAPWTDASRDRPHGLVLAPQLAGQAWLPKRGQQQVDARPLGVPEDGGGILFVDGSVVRRQGHRHVERASGT